MNYLLCIEAATLGHANRSVESLAHNHPAKRRTTLEDRLTSA